MATTVNASIANRSPNADSYYYCQPDSSIPWSSIQAAHDGIPQSYRGLGKKFLVMINDKQTECWYEGGLLVSNIIPVSESGILSVSLTELRTSTKAISNAVFVDMGLKSGVFRYDPTNTRADDGRMTIVRGSKRYIREYSEVLKPEWFGAVGDGVTDDYVAFQACLDFAATINKGAKIVLGPKTYLTGQTLKMKRYNDGQFNTYNITLEGAGRKVTIIRGTMDMTGNLMEASDGEVTTTARETNIYVSNLQFRSGGADRCFYARYIAVIMFTDVVFYGANVECLRIGVSESGNLNYNSHITRCYFWGYAEKLLGHCPVLVHAQQNQFLFIDKMESDAGCIGIWIENSSNSLIQNCKLEGLKHRAILIEGSYGGGHKIIDNEIFNYSGIDNKWIYQGTNAGIEIRGVVAAESNNLIAGNSIHVDDSFGAWPYLMSYTGTIGTAGSISSTIVTGLTSGAKGYFWGVDPGTGKMHIRVTSGTFVEGESFTKVTGSFTETGVITTIQEPVTYCIKTSVGFSANRIFNNLLANQTTYGMHLTSLGEMVTGNVINGKTGLYINGRGLVTGNQFYCPTGPTIVNVSNLAQVYGNIYEAGSRTGEQNTFREGLAVEGNIVPVSPTGNAGYLGNVGRTFARGYFNNLISNGVTALSNVGFKLHSSDTTARIYMADATGNLTLGSATGHTERLAVEGDTLITGGLQVTTLPTYADNAAATTGGLAVGKFYVTATGDVKRRY